MDANKVIEFLDSSPKTILKLKSTTLPVWGTMKAQHMVEHLSSAFTMSLKNKQYNKQINQDVVIKNKINVLANGFKPGINMSDGKVEHLKHPDLLAASNDYSQNLKKFLDAMSSNTSLLTSHFYFGPLTNEEWLVFHYWHVHHHYKQFGLL